MVPLSCVPPQTPSGNGAPVSFVKAGFVAIDVNCAICRPPPFNDSHVTALGGDPAV